MTITAVNLGTAVESGDGDLLRAAFAKLNANDGDLDTRLQAFNQIINALGTAASRDVGLVPGTVADGGLLSATQASLQTKLDTTGDASETTVAVSGAPGAPALATYLGGLPLTPRLISLSAGTGGDDTATLQTMAQLYTSTGRDVYIPDWMVLRISAPIVFMPPPGTGIGNPPPKITLGKRAKIIATAPMVSMIDFGSDASDYFGIIITGLIEGGVLDCAGLAGIGVRVPFFNNVTVRYTVVLNFQVAAIKFGSNSAPASSYEGFFENVTTTRRADLGPAPDGSAGVLYENAGDSHGLNSVLQGCKVGVKGPGLNDSKFTQVHVWNFAPAGPLDAGFYLAGDNSLVACQVDGPFKDAFRFGGARNSIVASAVNYGSYGGTDNTANVVRLDAGASARASGSSWKGGSGYRIASEVAGNTSGYQSFGNSTVYVVNIAGDRSPAQAKAWVQFNGATGAISDQVNVSSITRNGVGDYTVNIARDMTNTNYTLALSGYSDGNAANGILVFEAPTRGRFSFRIRAYDPVTFQFADSTRISATVFGNDTL